MQRWPECGKASAKSERRAPTAKSRRIRPSSAPCCPICILAVATYRRQIWAFQRQDIDDLTATTLIVRIAHASWPRAPSAAKRTVHELSPERLRPRSISFWPRARPVAMPARCARLGSANKHTGQCCGHAGCERSHPRESVLTLWDAVAGREAALSSSRSSDVLNGFRPLGSCIDRVPARVTAVRQKNCLI